MNAGITIGKTGIGAGAVDKLLAQVLPEAASMAERRAGAWLEPLSGQEGAGRMDARWNLWMEKCTRGDEVAFADLLGSRGLDVRSARAGLVDVRLVDGADLPPWAEALHALLVAATGLPPAGDVELVSSLTAGGAFAVTAEAKLPLEEGFGAVALSCFVGPARAWLSCDTSSMALEQGTSEQADFQVDDRSEERYGVHLKARSVGRGNKGTSVGGMGGTHGVAGEMAGAGAGAPIITDYLLKAFLAQVLHACLGCMRADDAVEFPAGVPPFEGWACLLGRYPAIGRVIGTIAVNWRDSALEFLRRLYSDCDDLEGLLAVTAVTESSMGIDTGDHHDTGRFVMPVDFEGGQRLLYKPKDLRLGSALSALLEVLEVPISLPERLERDGYIWEAFVRRCLPEGEVEWAELAREVGMWIRLFDVLGSTDMLGCNVVVAGTHLIPIDTETIIPFLFVTPESLPWIPVGVRTGLLTSPLITRGRRSLGDMGLLADPSYAALLDHLDSMLQGFETMHARLVERRRECMECLDGFEELPTRAVLRNTWVYYRLLMDSLAPESLRDGVSRDLVLERLWRAQQRYDMAVPLVESEIYALRDMDVPLFRFRPGGRDMVGPGGYVARDVLAEAPILDVRRRLMGLPPVPDQADLDALLAQAFCAFPDYGISRKAGGQDGIESVAMP
ncbi:MAG: DUF4135 domain-containing protein [Actinobacteria bacterium]|nr:DUF4135 domain-containing protein [Actinomycetota bacterium]